MNVGIFLGHPAHFHYFKNVAQSLIAKGHTVYFAVKKKDILEQLLQNAGFTYTKVRGNRGNTRWAMATSLVYMDINVVRFVRDNHINILLGVPPTCGTRLFTKIPIIMCGEDDAGAVPLSAMLLSPFAHQIVAPSTCSNGRFTNKSIWFPGYMELGYLHPNHFTPNRDVVEKYGIDTSKPYFIMRFSSLNAHHDKGIQGINYDIALRLVNILEPHGQIYITSERPLEPEFEPYRIHINPLDIHHVMAFASLYIGDSQTMAAEAGVLGTPFVRYNDFVGRIGYLDELEEGLTPLTPSPEERGRYRAPYLASITRHYDLGVGIRASEEGSVDRLCATVERLMSLTPEERHRIYDERRQRMLADKIDYAKFLTWFVEKYPASVKLSKEADADFWEKFK